MSNLALAGDVPADRNCACWQWLDADEGKPRTEQMHSHLVTWRYQERMLAQTMGKPTPSLTHEVSYTTISNSNSVHLPTSNTSTHTNSYFHATRVHQLMKSQESHGAHRLSKKAANKQGQQDGSLPPHSSTPTVPTWRLYSLSAKSRWWRIWYLTIGRNNMKINVGEVPTAPTTPSHFKPDTGLSWKNEGSKTGNTVLSKTTINLMHSLPVFFPIGFKL